MDTGVTIKLEKPTNRGYILDWEIDLDLALTYSVKLPDRNEWELGEPAYLAKGKPGTQKAPRRPLLQG